MLEKIALSFSDPLKNTIFIKINAKLFLRPKNAIFEELCGIRTTNIPCLLQLID